MARRRSGGLSDHVLVAEARTPVEAGVQCSDSSTSRFRGVFDRNEPTLKLNRTRMSLL